MDIEVKQEPAEVSLAEAAPNDSGTLAGNALRTQSAAHGHCYSSHQLSIGMLPWQSEERTDTKQDMEPALMRTNHECPLTCCPQCGNNAYLISSYEGHGSLYSCKKCCKTFTVNKSTHAVQLTDGDLQCPQCHKILSTYALLKSHITVVHEGLRPFFCRHCNKPFSRKSNLKRHLETVHEENKGGK